MSSGSCDGTIKDDTPRVPQRASDEAKTSIAIVGSAPLETNSSCSAHTEHDSEIPVTNIDVFIAELGSADDTVPYCPTPVSVTQAEDEVHQSSHFSTLEAGSNQGCLKHLGKTFLNSYSRNIGHLTDDSSVLSKDSNRVGADPGTQHMYNMVEDSESESDSTTDNSQSLNLTASGHGCDHRELDSEEEDVEICYGKAQPPGAQISELTDGWLSCQHPVLTYDQNMAVDHALGLTQGPAVVSLASKDKPDISTDHLKISQSSSAPSTMEFKRSLCQEQCKYFKDSVCVPSTECHINEAIWSCCKVEESVNVTDNQTARMCPSLTLDTQQVTVSNQGIIAKLPENASTSLRQSDTQRPHHSVPVDSRTLSSSNAMLSTKVSASITIKDKDREKGQILHNFKTMSKPPTSSSLRAQGPKLLNIPGSPVLNNKFKLQDKTQNRPNTSAPKLKGLSIKSKMKPKEQLHLKPISRNPPAESLILRKANNSPVQSPSLQPKKDDMTSRLKNTKQPETNGTPASPKLSDRWQDKTKSSVADGTRFSHGGSTLEVAPSANKSKESQRLQESPVLAKPCSQLEIPATQRTFIEVRLSSSSLSTPVMVRKEPMAIKDCNPTQRTVLQDKINATTDTSTASMVLPSYSILKVEKENGVVSQSSANEMHLIPSNSPKFSNTTEPGESLKSSRSKLYLKAMERRSFSTGTIIPGDPNPFSVRQKIKSFENLASLEKPVVKCIDIQSYAVTCRHALNQRLSDYMGLVSSIDDRALKTSSIEHLNSASSPSPSLGKSPSSLTLINFDQPPVDCSTVSPDKTVCIVPKASHGVSPATPPILRSKHARGHSNLSRTRIRELRALSMPELDKLCTDDFISDQGTVPLETDPGIPPIKATEVFSTEGSHRTVVADQTDSMTSEFSTQESPASFGPQPAASGWSISLKELASSPVEQSRLQAVLSSVKSKSDVLSLLQEAKALSEVKDDTHFVVLVKEEGSGLGFSIAGGVDLEQKSITVHRVFTKGVASLEGTIHRGDNILSINGTGLEGTTHGEALSSLHQARLSTQALVVIHRGQESNHNASPRHDVLGQPGRPSLSTKEKSVEAGTVVEVGPDGALKVELHKTSAGLGFSLEGGRASSHGDRPLNVKRIFKGGAAELSRVMEVGDEVLAINGHSLVGLMHYDAWNIIKAASDGPVHLLIRKPRTSV